MGPDSSPVRSMLFFPINWSVISIKGLPGGVREIPGLICLLWESNKMIKPSNGSSLRKNIINCRRRKRYCNIFIFDLIWKLRDFQSSKHFCWGSPNSSIQTSTQSWEPEKIITPHSRSSISTLKESDKSYSEHLGHN